MGIGARFGNERLGKTFQRLGTCFVVFDNFSDKSSKDKSGLGFRIFSGKPCLIFFHFHMTLIVSQVPWSLPVSYWHDAGIAWGATPDWYVFPHPYYIIPRFFRILAKLVEFTTLKKKEENLQICLLPKIAASQHQSTHVCWKIDSFWHFSFWKIVYSGRFNFPWQFFFCSLKIYFADIFNIYESHTISSRVNIFWLAMECKGQFYHKQ